MRSNPGDANSWEYPLVVKHGNGQFALSGDFIVANECINWPTAIAKFDDRVKKVDD